MPSAGPDKASVIRCFEDIFNHENAIAPVDKEPLFNNTGDSVPLTDFGMIHDALLLLSLLASDQDSNEICRLLQSPFIMPDSEETESLLQAQSVMRRNFSSRCSVAEISAVLENTKLSASSPQFSLSLLQSKTLLRSMPSNGSPRQWAGLFTKILEQFQWPGTRQSKEEKKLLVLWKEGLTLFAESSNCLGQLNHSGALRKFRSLLSKLSPRPGFSSKRQLSFYTVSESIGLRFDHAWLLGFDDQSWPPPSSPSPFLPYELQREHRMPASHGENQFAMAQIDGETIKANYGRFGPYIQYGKKYVSLKEISPEEVTLEEALELIIVKEKLDAERIIKVFEDSDIQVLNGRFGPYVWNGKKRGKGQKNVTVQKVFGDKAPIDLTLEECKKAIDGKIKAKAKAKKAKKKTTAKKKASS
jgi:hypothetical protein